MWPLFATVAIVACGGESTSSSPTVSPVTATESSTTTSTTTTTTTTLVLATSTIAPSSTTSSTTMASTVPPTTGPTTEDTMDPNTNPSVPASVLDSEIVRTAIADLSERTGADASVIEVLSVEEVEWPDGSIGCPQPGMVYTQALVNGTKIVLEFDGVTYDYHQGGSRPVFYCAPRPDK